MATKPIIAYSLDFTAAYAVNDETMMSLAFRSDREMFDIVHRCTLISTFIIDDFVKHGRITAEESKQARFHEGVRFLTSIIHEMGDVKRISAQAKFKREYEETLRARLVEGGVLPKEAINNEEDEKDA